MASKPVSTAIVAQHAAQLTSLPFHDTQDFEDADRGFIAALQPGVVRAADGRIVWDNDSYAFLAGEAPASVNPSLWRQSQLVAKQGLYEVVAGIYQVRGLDLSNITLRRGRHRRDRHRPAHLDRDRGRGPGALPRAPRATAPVIAVIYTHSHVDHFGGVFGVASEADVEAGRVQVIAPEGFIEHAVAENVYAGTAMSRRAGYMYGAALARGPQGQVGAGLGQTTSTGEVGLIVPTHYISETGQTMTVDGVEIEFQMAPGTEAPAEMHFYFPKLPRAVHGRERDPHPAQPADAARSAGARPARVVAIPHRGDRHVRRPRRRRLRLAPLADLGARARRRATSPPSATCTRTCTTRPCACSTRGTPGAEIAELIELPPALENAWSTHGYYGSVSHNVKAIYQRYMGWFDGNPARLWPHAPAAQAQRYVAAIGGIDRVVELAQSAFDDGDFRWAATLLDHAIFTDAEPRRGPGSLTPTPSSSWATARRTARGATSSCPVPRSCATGTSGRPPRPRRRRSSLSSHPSSSSIRSRSRSTGLGRGSSTCRSTSPSPISA